MNREVVNSRIVLCNKYNNDGELKWRKARIVVRDYSQRLRIDFQETFASVARQSTRRIMMALTAEYGMITNQCDATMANLNGKLEEEIFMEVLLLTEEILERIINWN